MPSAEHEALVMLFRNRPALAAELLRDACGVQLPEHSRAVLSSETMRNVRPVEIAADAVVVLEGDGSPRLATIVEVQLSIREDKRRAWPSYLVLLRRELGCPCMLLVIALDDAVARWSAQPIEIGHPGFVLRPLVIGREVVPRITDPRRAADDVELAVLSAVAHGKGNNALGVALTALHAIADLAAVDGERSGVYLDLVLAALSAATRAALEQVMKSNYEYQSEFMRNLLAKGLQEGRQEGVATGEADALLRVLGARGFVVDDATAARIRSCTDLATLQRWVTRAVTAPSLADVFDDAV